METVLGEIPVDARHFARLLASSAGTRVGLFYTSTGKEFASIPLADASRRSMASALAIIDEFRAEAAPKPPDTRDPFDMTPRTFTRREAAIRAWRGAQDRDRSKADRARFAAELPARLRALSVAEWIRFLQAVPSSERERLTALRAPLGAGAPEAPRPARATMPDVQWTSGGSGFEVLVSGEYPGTGAEWRTYDTAPTETSAKQSLAEARRRYPTKYGTRWKVAETPPLQHGATINGATAAIDTLFYFQRHERPMEFELRLRWPGERSYRDIGSFPTLEAAQREAVRLAMGAKRNGRRRGRR